MLHIVGLSILVAVAVDLIIGLLWVGLIGLGELLDTYNKVFPEGLKWLEKRKNEQKRNT